MEKTCVITLPMTIDNCCDPLVELDASPGWKAVTTDRESSNLRAHKGNHWLRRRHDFRISLSERDPDSAELGITIKDVFLIYAGGKMIARELDEVVRHLLAIYLPIEV